MIEWKIQGSRVYGNGQSYNCTNRVTAEQLHNTLTTYEKTVQLNKNIEQQFDKLTRQVIQVQMTLKILDDEINNLTSDINAIKNRQ